MRELFPNRLSAQYWTPLGRFPVECESISLDTLPSTGLIRLQGNAAETALALQVLQTTGLELPDPCRHVSRNGFTLAWAAPNEWLLFCSPQQEDEKLNAFIDAFASSFVTATPLSDGRIGFEVSGDAADDFIAKGCAIDTHDASFDAGALAITRFAGLTAMLIRTPDAYRLYFDVSYQAYILDWMLDATAEWTAT